MLMIWEINLTSIYHANCHWVHFSSYLITEAAKFALKYLVHCAKLTRPDSELEDLKDRLLCVDPILEGN